MSLLVIDEIHLLGADRGPILEVIVSRMRYITTQTGHAVRFVGLSTALANARDIGDWLGIDKVTTQTHPTCEQQLVLPHKSIAELMNPRSLPAQFVYERR